MTIATDMPWTSSKLNRPESTRNSKLRRKPGFEIALEGGEIDPEAFLQALRRQPCGEVAECVALAAVGRPQLRADVVERRLRERVVEGEQALEAICRHEVAREEGRVGVVGGDLVAAGLRLGK